MVLQPPRPQSISRWERRLMLRGIFFSQTLETIVFARSTARGISQLSQAQVPRAFLETVALQPALKSITRRPLLSMVLETSFSQTAATTPFVKSMASQALFRRLPVHLTKAVIWETA